MIKAANPNFSTLDRCLLKICRFSIFMPLFPRGACQTPINKPNVPRRYNSSRAADA